MDEHDPQYNPDDLWEDEIPGPHWVILAVAAALLFALLMGCDGEYERHLRVAEFKDRFINSCMPRKGDTVTVQWVKGELVCRRITPSGRYGKTFPHVEVTVATMDDETL